MLNQQLLDVVDRQGAVSEPHKMIKLLELMSEAKSADAQSLLLNVVAFSRRPDIKKTFVALSPPPPNLTGQAADSFSDYWQFHRQQRFDHTQGMADSSYQRKEFSTRAPGTEGHLHASHNSGYTLQVWDGEACQKAGRPFK